LDDSGDADFNMDLDKPRKLKERFNTIIAGEEIEHPTSPFDFVKYFKSLLKKRGWLVLTTPNTTGMRYLINPS